MNLATPSALAAISFYQRFVSPYKGFRCAHAALHHGNSCSQAVKKLIAEHGLWRSRDLVKARFAECRTAFELLKQTAVLSTREDEESERRKQQRKEYLQNCGCDLPQLGCDLAQLLPCRGKAAQLDCLPDVCMPDAVCSCW